MKRKIKYILLFVSSVIILCTTVFVVVVATLDNNDYRKIFVRSVEHFVGYKVMIDGAFVFNLGTEPYLVASGLRFDRGKDGSRPFITHIGHLKLKLDAIQLVTGTLLIKHLMVDDATVSLHVGGDRETPASGRRIIETVSPVLVPVFEKAALQNIKINVLNKANGDLAKIELHRLTIDDLGESGLRYVKGKGMVNHRDFQIEGRSGSFAEIFNQHQPYPVSLDVNTVNFHLNVSGSVDNFIQKEGLDLRVTSEVAELSKALKLFKIECPGLGQATLEAAVTGSMAAPSVSDLHINISGDTDTQITAIGSVNNMFNGNGTHILINGSTANNALLRMLLPGIMADFSQLGLKGRLHDRQTDFILDVIDAQGSNDHDLAMKAQGLLNFGALTKDPLFEAIDLNLQLTSPTTEVAKRFLIDALPEIGPVTGKGRLTGSAERLSLEDLYIGINESGPLKVTSKGRIGQIPTRAGMSISEIDLNLSIQAERTRLISSVWDVPLPELGPLSASYRLRYADDRIKVDQVDVRTSNRHGLKVELSGNIGNIPYRNHQPPGHVNLRIRMSAPNVGAVEPLLGARMLTDFGPVVGDAKISGTTQSLSLENVVITAGHPSSAYGEMRGRVGKIPVKSGRVMAMAECDMLASIQTEAASNLGSLFGVSIPHVGPLRATWRLVDRNGAFGFDDIKLVMGHKMGSHFEAEGKIHVVDWNGDVTAAGIDMDISATIPHEDTQSALNDIGLADLGSLIMKAKISGGDGGLDIRQLTIRARHEEKTSLLIAGDIHGVQRKEKIEVTGKFETYTQPWVEKLIQRPATENFKLLGQLKLSGDTKHILIEKLQIETEGQEPLTLNVSGKAKKMDGYYKTNVQLSASATDPSVIGSILGISLPPFSPLNADGRLGVNVKKAEFEGEVRLGQSVLKTNARRSIRNHKPKMDVIVYSPVIYLSDLGMYPEVLVKETEKKVSEPTPKDLFSKEPFSFDVFKSLDFSLNIDVDQLIGKDFEMDTLDVDVILSDGRLRIGPAKLGYAGGDVSFEATLKADESKPEVTIKANAEDLDVDAFLAYAHKPLILGGQLNLIVDLHSVGNSPQEMASSLKGELGMALENGRIKRDIEMLTADAIDVITDLPKLKDYQDLNCLILKFVFKEGVGKSKIIFYDTPNVKTRGIGSINLGSETLDIVLQPNPKKGIPELSSAIYINGPIANPSIRIIPFKEAARLAGEILMPYVFLPARALGYLWYLLKDDEDEQSPCLIENHHVE